MECTPNNGQVVKQLLPFWGVHMKQRRTYTREFKLNVLQECENGKEK